MPALILLWGDSDDDESPFFLNFIAICERYLNSKPICEIVDIITGVCINSVCGPAFFKSGSRQKCFYPGLNPLKVTRGSPVRAASPFPLLNPFPEQNFALVPLCGVFSIVISTILLSLPDPYQFHLTHMNFLP